MKTLDLATAAVTKEKLNPNAVNLVVIQRNSEKTTIEVNGVGDVRAHCEAGEVVTG